MKRPVPAFALCAAVMSLVSACGESSDRPTGPSSAVTPPAPTTGIIQGIVKHETYISHGVFPEGPLPGAQVFVTAGPGAGQSVTTGADGAYRFDLPAGPFRVRGSAQGFEPRESDSGTVIAGSTTTVNVVVLQLLSNVIGDWSITGIVRDGVGNPVAGASVDSGDGVTWAVGSASTDGAGRYVLTPKRLHPNTLHITAWKEGYRGQYRTVPCMPSCAMTMDFRLLRIIRQWLDGPSTLKVGEVAAVRTVDEYDDGSRTVYRATVNSSNSAVVRVLTLEPPYQTTYVKAIAPGTATLQLLGQPVTLNVRVVP